MCVYGDSVYEFNLRKMIRQHKESKAFVTMALLQYSTKLKYGFIDINGHDRVTSWREKPEISGLINIGSYIMRAAVFEDNTQVGIFWDGCTR